MLPERKDSKLESLQESLYDPKHPATTNVRRVIHEKEFDVPQAWNEKTGAEEPGFPPKEERVNHSSKLPLIVLSISFLVCIIAGLFALYRLNANSTSVTQDLIALESVAPQFIDGGVEFDYVVTLSNQNTTNLELVDLEVSYPQGVLDTKTSQIVITKDVGSVLPNSIVEEKFPLTLYGIPGTTKPITTTLRYNVPGSTATFEKKETKVVEIKSSPLVVSIDALKEVTSGQEMNVKIRIEATRGKTIPETLLKLTYPTGFEFLRADVTPTTGSNTWSLSALAPGVVQEITITGIPRGEDKEFRTFKAEVGTRDGVSTDIAALFAEAKAEYVLTKPFLQTDILIAGTKAPVHTVSSDADIAVSLTYKNNTDVKLQNVEVFLTLQGSAINESTIRVRDGTYDSRTDTVRFTRSGVLAFENLEPGATGKLDVSFKTKSSASLDSNEEIKLEVSAKARRVGESQISETVLASQNTLLRVVTRIALLAETARSAGGYIVFGPVPPRGEQETSYVLITEVKNTVNPVEKAEVSFNLPDNVRFIGGGGSQGTVTYSAFDRQVRWVVGDIVRSGSVNDPVLYVHVAVIPSLTDIGLAPILAKSFTMKGIDTFTKRQLSANGPAVLTTKFRLSDGFQRGDDLVNQ